MLILGWYINNRPRPRREIYAPLSPYSFNDVVRFCNPDGKPPVYAFLIYVLQGAFLAAGTALAIATRNVPSDYNEAKQLLAVFLIIVIVSVISVPVVHMQADPLPALLLKAVAIVMTTLAVSLVLFLPRILHLYGFDLGSLSDTNLTLSPTRTSQIQPCDSPKSSQRMSQLEGQGVEGQHEDPAASSCNLSLPGYELTELLAEKENEVAELRDRNFELSERVALLEEKLRQLGQL